MKKHADIYCYRQYLKRTLNLEMQQFKSEPVTGKRVLATIIDYIIVFAFFFWYVMMFGSPNEEGGNTVSGWPTLVPILFWALWLIGTESYCGQTLGHALMGLKVIGNNGSAITFGQSLKRRLCDAIEISWCFGLIAFIIVKGNERHQRLGDIIAKTIVVAKDQDVLPEFDFDSELPLTSALQKQD